MGLVIFWSVTALFLFALSVVTGIELCRLRQKLSKLEDMSPTGISNGKGEFVPVETVIYKVLKAILITDIIGFLVTTAAAIASAIITTE
jgi:hypothetical protein